MHYIHFRASHQTDYVYESGIAYHPFLKELNINKPLAFIKEEIAQGYSWTTTLHIKK